MIDEGTLGRWQSPAPGPVGTSPPVGDMPLDDRFIEVLQRTLPLLPAEVREEFAQLLSPTNLLIIVGTLVVWAGSHYFGVGFVMDAILLAAGAIFLGLQVLTAASDFVLAIKLTAEARSEADLDQASRHLANFVAVVGVAVFTALVFRGARKVAPRARAAIAGAAAGRYGGMTPTHFRVFQDVARTMKRIIVVRNTNPKSTQWIERGFPPKPMEIKIKTSQNTGIVTALKAEEIRYARSKGYYVVDADGVPRNALGQEMRFTSKPEWPMEPGQIVHPQQQKPLVGDYDLLGVINPEAPGRNIALAASEGKVLDDWTNPEVRRIAEALNNRMDQPRVMHGAHDMYSKGKPDLSDVGGSTVFLPDGTTRSLNTADDVAAFYQELGRQTITGKY
jgi:hypothetical protein